jgi:hypothetical protein
MNYNELCCQTCGHWQCTCKDLNRREAAIQKLVEAIEITKTFFNEDDHKATNHNLNEIFKAHAALKRARGEK